MNKVVMFLDVDGSILCAPEHADKEATVIRKIVQQVEQRNVAGFHTPSTKTFEIETEIWWRNATSEFFKEHRDGLQIVWLTGWKHNAPLLNDFFHASQTSVLEWEVTPDESGKKAALIKWLEENPVDSFIWVDDVATIGVGSSEFSVPNLILTPNEDVALNDSELNQLSEFIVMMKTVSVL